MNHISTVNDELKYSLEDLVHQFWVDGVPEVALWMMICEISEKNLRDIAQDART